MLTGNKFYRVNLGATPTVGETNYTDVGANTPSVGSSYTPKFYGGSYGSMYNQAEQTASVQPYNVYANMEVPENNPYQTVSNYQYSLGSVGQSVPQRKGAGLGNALMTVLDVMQRPQYMVTNVLDELTDDSKSSFKDVLFAAVNGLTGERKSSVTDTFNNLGWENDSSKKWWQGGNLVRNVAGFAGDVLLDPTTYLSGGSLSLAKGLGAKSVGEGIEDAGARILSTVGDDLFKKSSDDIVSGIAKFIAKDGDDLADVGEKVAASIAKQGKQGDFLSRLAYAIGDYSSVSDSSVLVAKNKELVETMLDKGVGSLNKDMVSEFLTTPLKKQLDTVMAGAPMAQEKFNRTVAQSLNRKLNDVFKFELKPSTLEDYLSGTGGIKQLDSVRGIVDALTGASTKTVTEEFKSTVVKKLYKDVTDTLPDDAVFRAMSDKEFDVLDTLCDAFNVSEKTQADTLIEAAQKTARMRKSTVKNLSTAVGELDSITGVIRKVDNGVEFGNGLRRVFDKANKTFFIQYNNPFTGKVKPLLEISQAAPNSAARAVWNSIIEFNPLNPVTSAVGRQVEKLATGIADKFQTEHISRGIMRMVGGESDPARLESAKQLAHQVTQFIQKETALPRRALSALRMFESIPEFFTDDNLRKAASIYIERNNSSIAKAGWLYLSKQGLDDAADDALKKAYADITGSPVVRQFLDGLGFDPAKISTVSQIAEKNLMFNEAIAQYDGANYVNFLGSPNYIDVGDVSSMSYVERAATGNLDKDRMAGYARINDNTDSSMYDPTAKKSGRRSVQHSDEDITSTRLGGKKDSRSIAISDTTGAFEQRSYQSALDRLIANPTHDIDFDMATRVARRTLESERVVLNTKFVQSIRENIDDLPGFDTLVSEKATFEGAEAVPLMGGKVTFYAHPEIANQLKRVASVFDDASVSSAAVDEVFASVSNVLKSLQTKYNPAFELRNAIGEPLMNWVAGVSRDSGDQAREIMKAVNAEDLFRVGDTTFASTGGKTQKLYREFTKDTELKDSAGHGTGKFLRDDVLEYAGGAGKVESAKNIDIAAQRQKIIDSSGANVTYYQMGSRKMTASQIMTEFYNAGLGWSGVTKGNQAKNMRGLLEQEMLKVTPKNGVVGAAKTLNEKMGKPGDYIETWSRLSQFVDCLKKNMDVDSAAMEVRKFHVDYRDLTQFERKYLRNVLPYYTYMRKNVPIQFKLLISRQNKVNIIGQLVDSMYEAVQRDNGDKPLNVPDYLKEGLAIPIDVDDEGKVTYLNWGIPIADVARFKYGVKELLTENFFSMLSPMAKVPLEYSVNKDINYGSDLESYTNEEQQLLPGVEGSPTISTLANQTLNSLGVVNTVRKAVGAGVSAEQRGESGFSAALRSALLGSFMPQKAQSDVALQQAYDYRDQLYAYIQQLRANGTYVPQYTPSMQYKQPQSNPWAPSERVNQSTKQGYLGTPDSQLYAGLLKQLIGR